MNALRQLLEPTRSGLRRPTRETQRVGETQAGESEAIALRGRPLLLEVRGPSLGWRPSLLMDTLIWVR